MIMMEKRIYVYIYTHGGEKNKMQERVEESMRTDAV